MAEHSGEPLDGEALLERVAGIARLLAEAETVDTTLQRIVDLGHDYIAGCEAASVSFIRNRRFISTPVWSRRLGYDTDQTQYRVGQGPCLDAISQHETVIIDDLETEQRWPDWRSVALELGVRSVISFRLFMAADDEDTMGALNLYSRSPHVFGERARAVGQVFASHAAVALKAAITEAGLEDALRSRDVIGQAKGVVMEREKLTAHQAFERLHELAGQNAVTIRDLAEQIVETGELP